jgi:hypothetical protein
MEGDLRMFPVLHHTFDAYDETNEEQHEWLHAFVEMLMPQLERQFTMRAALLQKTAGGGKVWQPTEPTNGLLIVRFFPSSVPILFDLSGAISPLTSQEEQVRVFLLVPKGVSHQHITIQGSYMVMPAYIPSRDAGEAVLFIEELLTQRMAGVGLGLALK